MPGYWDPVEKAFVYRGEFRCIQCGEIFPSYSFFLDHGRYRQVASSKEIVWQCDDDRDRMMGDGALGYEDDLNDGRVPGLGVKDKELKDIIGVDSDAELETFSRFLKEFKDRQFHQSDARFISISKEREKMMKYGDPCFRNFELSSSSQPESSYRNSPISAFAWQNRNHVSIASPRSFNTAQSSLASYVTASSVPHSRWQPTGLQNATATESSRPALGSVNNEPDDYYVNNMDASFKPNNEFEPLVDWVATQIQNTFRTSSIRPETLRMIVRGCLWDLTPTEPSSVKPRSMDDSKKFHEQVEDIELNPESGPVAGTNDHSPDDDTEVALETDTAQDLHPLDRLFYMLARCEDRIGMRAYRFEELEDPERLRRQLASTIRAYLARQLILTDTTDQQVFSSQWLKHLHERGILLDWKDELNWSGRGQHVEYEAEEESEIPLQMKKVLGHSASAIVESVQCRRILLARKTVKCNRRLTKENVVVEVEHLQRLQHWHVVRVVGTYTLRKNLSILLYPSADQNLEELMDDIVELEPEDPGHGLHVMPMFFGCLSNAISFIHTNNVKHMDIKPKNILVRQMNDHLKVYIADFGIARAYKSAAESFTDSPTSFTRTYAAPEVIIQDTRGFPADIFSLGCVFMEMFACMISTPTKNMRDSLACMRETDYQAHIDEVFDWYAEHCSASWLWRYMGSINPIYMRPTIAYMLSRSPEDRPFAHDLEKVTARLCCTKCNHGPEPFEAVNAELA
jgi:tRNA A-37 threonylcarbamoyl transferase component Bud32